MRNVLIPILTLFLIVACDSKQVLDQYESLPGQWSKNQTVSFNFQAPDTTNAYNLFLNLRNNNDYAFSNLFLIVSLETPNDYKMVDTLQYAMTNPDGSWLGTGFSDIKENKLWYKENLKFKAAGTYKLSIDHAMRKNGSVLGIDELQGITEVGFRIENTDKK